MDPSGNGSGIGQNSNQPERLRTTEEKWRVEKLKQTQVQIETRL